eukprot:scaffold109_cov252-Pinguiococcus_pyrenoidosus.AAC.37
MTRFARSLMCTSESTLASMWYLSSLKLRAGAASAPTRTRAAERAAHRKIIAGIFCARQNNSCAKKRGKVARAMRILQANNFFKDFKIVREFVDYRSSAIQKHRDAFDAVRAFCESAVGSSGTWIRALVQYGEAAGVAGERARRAGDHPCRQRVAAKRLRAASTTTAGGEPRQAVRKLAPRFRNRLKTLLSYAAGESGEEAPHLESGGVESGTEQQKIRRVKSGQLKQVIPPRPQTLEQQSGDAQSSPFFRAGVEIQRLRRELAAANDKVAALEESSQRESLEKAELQLQLVRLGSQNAKEVSDVKRELVDACARVEKLEAELEEMGTDKQRLERMLRDSEHAKALLAAEQRQARRMIAQKAADLRAVEERMTVEKENSTLKLQVRIHATRNARFDPGSRDIPTIACAGAECSAAMRA